MHTRKKCGSSLASTIANLRICPATSRFSPPRIAKNCDVVPSARRRPSASSARGGRYIEFGGNEMLTRYSEDRDDIENVEAWAEVIRDLLYLTPMEQRGAVLVLAAKNEEVERREREAHSGL